MLDVANKKIMISGDVVVDELKCFDSRKNILTCAVTGYQNVVTGYERNFLDSQTVGTGFIEGVTGYQNHVNGYGHKNSNSQVAGGIEQ